MGVFKLQRQSLGGFSASTQKCFWGTWIVCLFVGLHQVVVVTSQRDGDYIFLSLASGEAGYTAADPPLDFELKGSLAELNWEKVSAGGRHTCGIKRDGALKGNLFCWGRSEEGQTTIPTQHQSAVWDNVWTGYDLTCGTTAAAPASLICWGAANKPLLQAPPDSPSNAPWTKVAIGRSHACGLAGGSLSCWGEDTNSLISFSQQSAVQQASFLDVCSAFEHSCVVRTDNRLICWGYSGLGRTVIPREIRSVNWAQVSCGGSHTCGMDTRGYAACWGHSAHGQLELLDPRLVQIADIRAEKLRLWDSLHSGFHHVCGHRRLREDEVQCDDLSNTVPTPNHACWGDDSFGAIVSPHHPIQYKELAIQACFKMQFKQITSGGYHSCGITIDDNVGNNKLICWGFTDDGQLEPITPEAGAALLPNILISLFLAVVTSVVLHM